MPRGKYVSVSRSVAGEGGVLPEKLPQTLRRVRLLRKSLKVTGEENKNTLCVRRNRLRGSVCMRCTGVLFFRMKGKHAVTNAE